MDQTELEKIRLYWMKKYPGVDVRLWSNEYGTKHFGQMVDSQRVENFSADTIGQVISMGEKFLRG